MSTLKTLGMAPATPAALFATTTAEAPITMAQRSRATGRIHTHRPRPTNNLDPEKRQRAGALIELMAGSAFSLDYSLRQMTYLGVMKQAAKQQLGLTTAHVDKLMVAIQAHFGLEDSDYFNQLSDSVGEALRLFCSLDAGQKQAAMTHMQEMAKANLVYIPAPTPYSED
ncbi:hypothetical protein [Hymenobacter fodinae]|uniref:Uncharacterized protein n=1 Tax=Hymenobacter fodinae TaxID=2510796 RepID=A0A4Z0P3S2_9BACT|nr:hypothetical protein [Hymenobacter fodinae]TGE05598.1 hypothetical protein EU556_20060 [Hymenobacter fodinae]